MRLHVSCGFFSWHLSKLLMLLPSFGSGVGAPFRPQNKKRHDPDHSCLSVFFVAGTLYLLSYWTSYCYAVKIIQ